MNVGDLVRTPSGKEGMVLALFKRRESDEGIITCTPRVLVLVPCALGPTEYLRIRVAYAPEDLEDMHESHA